MLDAPDPILPFGKHKGSRCSEIPVECLDWLIGQDWMQEKPALLNEITEHLRGRPEWARLGDDD